MWTGRSDEEWSDDCPSDEFGSDSKKKKKKKKKARDEDEILFAEGGTKKKQAKNAVEADGRDTSGSLCPCCSLESASSG